MDPEDEDLIEGPCINDYVLRLEESLADDVPFEAEIMLHEIQRKMAEDYRAQQKRGY